jgi:CheY-like chemotaxis protein
MMGESLLKENQTITAVSTSAEQRFILVVDDNELDRCAAGLILERQSGVRVVYANHGKEALKVVQQLRPDLVLTDLHMPLMDGLALVEVMRHEYPLIPTILMTDKGSDDLALLALERGAASYVSKRTLADDLAETAGEIMAVAQAGRQQWRLRESWRQTEFQFLLDNDAALIPIVSAHVQQYLTTVQHRDAHELVRVSVALNEALRNAMHHGNLELDSQLRRESPEAYYQLAEQRRSEEPYRRRRVHVTAAESRVEARYVIRDEGSGFDPGLLSYDPTDAAHLELPSGRGLLLMRMFMHEVQYNAQGNEVTLVHRRSDVAHDEAASNHRINSMQAG